MNAKQEPKYEIKSGKIHNRQSGEQIPDDEPIFILRARDANAAATLEDYRGRCGVPVGDHHKAVTFRLEQFRAFAATHPERMKEPDTILTKDWEKLSD